METLHISISVQMAHDKLKCALFESNIDPISTKGQRLE